MHWEGGVEFEGFGQEGTDFVVLLGEKLEFGLQAVELELVFFNRFMQLFLSIS